MALGLIALGTLLLFPPAEEAPASPPVEETPAPASTPAPTPAPVTVRLHGPEGTVTLRLAPGDTLVPEEAPLEGYTFLRWQDGAGRALPAGGITVWEDGDYYPVYAMRLGKAGHTPYLSLDENGAFRPAEPITRREAVCVLYGLLDTELVGDGRFLDVPEGDEAFRAAATLKQLGVLSGSRLHPDETITRRELLEMLCPFFPEGTQEAVFADLTPGDEGYPLFRTAAERGWIESGPEAAALPDRELTRLDFARMLNRALDRRGDRDHNWQLVGTILDLSHDDPAFWDAAEAAVAHRYTGEGAEERWTGSSPLPAREEGLFFLGTELHAIGADGNPVVNGEYAGLRFDAYGAETSGDAALDIQIRALLEELVDPAAMEPEEMLHILFEYTVRHFRYRPGNFYPFGEPSGWEAAEALALLEEERGNCYSFAALFYELARAIGYDATAYTGAVISNREGQAVNVTDVHGDPLLLPAGYSPHGWVEIEFDGVPYIFDPEYGYRILNRGYADFGFFKLGDQERARYGYLYSPETQYPMDPSVAAARAALPESTETPEDEPGTSETPPEAPEAPPETPPEDPPRGE